MKNPRHFNNKVKYFLVEQGGRVGLFLNPSGAAVETHLLFPYETPDGSLRAPSIRRRAIGELSIEGLRELRKNKFARTVDELFEDLTVTRPAPSIRDCVSALDW